MSDILTADSAPETNVGAAQPTILAVDDQVDQLRLLKRRLEDGGMRCVAIADPVAALEFLQRETVDAIILDLMMPVLDGYEVCRRVKADERTRDIPVIFLTARLNTEDRVQALNMGGHDYLTKPVQQKELLARTRAAVRIKFLQDQLKSQLRLQQELHQLQNGMVNEHWQKTFGQLAASLAHEINNPLAAALGTTQLLMMQSGLGDEVLQPLHIIDQSLQRAGQRLRSLLLIAKPGRQTQKVLLSRLTSDIVTIINYQVVMNKITVVTQLDPECEWQGPPGELARAVLYLVNNAIEATAGTPSPRLTLRLDRPGRFFRFTISDNGPGISDAVRHRLFAPFVTTKDPGHNGLGLYLANTILHQLGGRIEFASPGEHGMTDFQVLLPAPGETAQPS